VGPDHSREEAFLAGAARAFVWGEPPGSLEAAARLLDWEWILRRAEAERLAPLLYAVGRRLPVLIPILDRLRTAWVAGRRQHLLGVEQLRGLLSAFEADGVAVILLKGPALGEALYPDPGLRPFTDLDLLVPETDLARTLELLSARGYRHLEGGRPLAYEVAYAGAACFVRREKSPEDLPLDVHWRLLDHLSGSRAAAADLQEVWTRAIKVEGWGWPILAFCPEDLLLYLALHLAFHHALSGIVWELDLALLLRRYGDTLDWEGVAERARRWRVRGALYFALRAVQEHFDVGAPPLLLARLRPRGLRPAVFEWLRRRRGEQLERLDYLVPFLVMDQGSDLLRALARGALPAGEWVRCRYGARSLVEGYLAHYARIGKVCLRTVRAAFPLTVPLPLTPPAPPRGERIQGEGADDSR